MKRRPTDSVHFTFEGGEADAQYERRGDADLWSVTAKRIRNLRILAGGGCKRRPGLARALALSGAARLIPFTARDGTKRLLALRNGNLDVIKTDETIEATVSAGVPWSGGDVATIEWAQYDDAIIVASHSFFPKKLKWAAGAFTVADFPFVTRTDGSRGWPYYRFRETRGITIAPSALTGAGITLTASSALFTASWVGIKLLLLNREVLITAYTDSTHVTATVVQTLYQTRRFTVTSSSGFAPGQVIQSKIEGWEMEVCNIPDATHVDAIYMDSFTDPTTVTNTLEGPNGESAMTAVAAPGAEGATIQWEEQLISTLRGYPGTVMAHKDRLIFADFTAAPEIHAMSIIGTIDDFDLGTALDDEGILDGPGNAQGRRVRHCVSSEQLVTLTEAGSYYIGEGPNTPLTPSNDEFLLIGPEPAGDCNPVLAAEGIVFVEATAGRIMLLAPTGQVRRVWGAAELAPMAAELTVSPFRLTLVDGCDWGPERYLIVINSDGTLCVINWRRDSQVAGAMLWYTGVGGVDDDFVDVAVFNNKVYAVVLRSGAYALERFDDDRLLDNSVLFSNVSPAVPTNAAFVSRANVALVWRSTLAGVATRADLGTLYTGTAGGVLTGAPTNSRDYEGGTRFDVLLRPWPPIDPQTGAQRHMRVHDVSVDTLDSGLYYLMGAAKSAYRLSDDPSIPPPMRTGQRTFNLLNRRRDFDLDITQVEAAPLHVRMLVMGVS